MSDAADSDKLAKVFDRLTTAANFATRIQQSVRELKGAATAEDDKALIAALSRADILLGDAIQGVAAILAALPETAKAAIWPAGKQPVTIGHRVSK